MRFCLEIHCSVKTNTLPGLVNTITAMGGVGSVIDTDTAHGNENNTHEID